MDLRDRVIVITGGGSGIGEALAHRFAAESPTAMLLADVALANVEAVADAVRTSAPGVVVRAVRCDVADAESVTVLTNMAIAEHGHLELFCSNAGIATGRGVDAEPAVWQRIWEINVMSHVYAATALLQHATAAAPIRLMITASAAGLLTNLGDAPYTATKHAAVGLAEWLAITHGGDGLKVSCLCPQGVRTPLVTSGLSEHQLAARVVEAMGLIEPEQCAETVVEALGDERFLILPHPEVATYQQAKADAPDRWIAAMVKLSSRLTTRDG